MESRISRFKKKAISTFFFTLALLLDVIPYFKIWFPVLKYYFSCFLTRAREISFNRNPALYLNLHLYYTAQSENRPKIRTKIRIIWALNKYRNSRRDILVKYVFFFPGATSLKRFLEHIKFSRIFDVNNVTF